MNDSGDDEAATADDMSGHSNADDADDDQRIVEIRFTAADRRSIEESFRIFNQLRRSIEGPSRSLRQLNEQLRRPQGTSNFPDLSVMASRWAAFQNFRGLSEVVSRWSTAQDFASVKRTIRDFVAHAASLMGVWEQLSALGYRLAATPNWPLGRRLPRHDDVGRSRDTGHVGSWTRHSESAPGCR